MTSLREQFATEVETYIAASGMTATDFGLAAMNDRSFVHRLREGLDVRAGTIDKVRGWMANHPLDRPTPRKRARADSRVAA